MRLFIAIPIKDDLKEILADLQNDIRQTQSHIRFVQPENIHLSLRFIGETDEKFIPNIIEIIKKAAANNQAFRIEIKNIGAFPRVKNPRVIWAGCNEVKKLSKIYQEIEGGLTSFGFPPNDRSFSPHITLGRVKSSKNKNNLVRFLEEKNNFVAGTQKAEKITLFQSQLKPTGAVYTDIYSGIIK